MPEKIIELKPIKESPSYYDEIERRLRALFRKEIYVPIMRALGGPVKTVRNAKEDDVALLFEALQTGRITFNRGVFSGKFNAEITKALRAVGATWDRKSKTFRAQASTLPIDLRHAISASEGRFQEKINKIDDKLSQILPEEIAGKIKLSDQFDRTLWKVNKDFEETVKGITVSPKLTPEMRKKIADEWQNNMKIYIKDFAEEEIKKLRKDLQASVFKGNRYESAIKSIQESYGVSLNKAKFLARQETSLLMTKFKETRYLAAGIKEYTWHSVVGSPKHPVRPRHKALAEASKKGTIYRWDQPPVTTEPGQPERRNNPGQDYNCRCFAKPVVRFRA